MKLARYLIIILAWLGGAQAFAQTDAVAAPAAAVEAPPPATVPAATVEATTATSEEAATVQPTGKDSSSLGYNVLLETKEERFNVGIFAQFSNFSRAGQTFTGNPFEVLAGYALTEKIGFNINLMQALDMANGASVLYSGLRSSASYTFLGQNFSRRSTVLVNGAPSVSITPFQQPTFSADVGFEQIFFNGTSRVAPGTGMSFGGQYARTISTYRIAVMVRYGQLKVADDDVTLMTAGAGLLYRF
jgi:hypothetical protein